MDVETRARIHARMRIISATEKYPPRVRRAVLSDEGAGLLDPGTLDELNSFIDRFPLVSHESIDWNVIPGSVTIEYGEEDWFPVAWRALGEFVKEGERVIVVWGATGQAPCWMNRNLLEVAFEEMEEDSWSLWFIKLESREVFELGNECVAWGFLDDLSGPRQGRRSGL